MSDGRALKFRRCPSRSQILRQYIAQLQTEKSNNAFSLAIARIIHWRRLLTNANFRQLIAAESVQQLPVYHNEHFSYLYLIKICLASAADIFIE